MNFVYLIVWTLKNKKYRINMQYCTISINVCKSLRINIYTFILMFHVVQEQINGILVKGDAVHLMAIENVASVIPFAWHMIMMIAAPTFFKNALVSMMFCSKIWNNNTILHSKYSWVTFLHNIGHNTPNIWKMYAYSFFCEKRWVNFTQRFLV